MKDLILNYELNRLVSNTITALGVTLALTWCNGWRMIVMCLVVVLANVAGHGEGLTREYKR